MKKVTALHFFERYLEITENWIYKMLLYVPETRRLIASKYYLKNDFYHTDFEFVRVPAQGIISLQYRNMVGAALTYLLRPFLGWLYEMQLASQLKHRKPDLIHSHFAIRAWQIRNLPQKMKIPHVISFYGFDYERVPQTMPVWKERYQWLFRHADGFLCEGVHGKSILVKMGCPEHKVFVNKLGVEVDKIPFTERKKKAKELKMVQIARMTEKKGHIYTAKAFIQASQRCPGIKLTFVGADVGGVKKSIRSLLEEAKLQEEVTFLDSIDYTRLYEFMKDYHVFIHPSCYAQDKDCEGGAPIVLLDAQATGMPVISTFHCDIPDEVKDGETGILAKEKDTQAIANAIETFYQMETADYESMSRSCRQHVDEHYNIKTNAKGLKTIYDQLVKSEQAVQS